MDGAIHRVAYRTLKLDLTYAYHGWHRWLFSHRCCLKSTRI